MRQPDCFIYSISHIHVDTMLFDLKCYQQETILLLSVTTMVRMPGLSGMPIDMGVCMDVWAGLRIHGHVHGYTRIYTCVHR